MRRRWIMLAAGLPLYVLTLMVIGTVSLGALVADDVGGFLHDIMKLVFEPGWWMTASIAAGIVAGSQGIFLLPVFQFRRPRAERGKSLVFSALLLALVAGLLVTGLVAGLSELFGPWAPRGSPPGTAASGDAGDQWWFPALFLSTLIGSWAVFSVMLIGFVRRARTPEDQLGRLIGLLFGGTIVEVLVILPIDVMVRRRTDCYCNTGTFFALAFSIAATLWLAGPGIFIALTAKKRRAWRQTNCEMCGYEKGPSPGERCPECGFEWTPEKVRAKPQAAEC